MQQPEAGSHTLRSALDEAAAQLALDITEPDLNRLLAYLDLLRRWNGTYNLTAVRELRDMLTQHLVDCLAVIEPLRRHVGAQGSGALPPRVLDVGSGGGLPGVVIALLNPQWSVVCVDTVGKKAAFIRQAAVELRLPNLRSEHARVEGLMLPAFDLITARAFASLSDLVRLTRPHLSGGGVWAAMKGKVPNDEIRALPNEVLVFHVEQLRVPGLDAQRCLVWLRPEAENLPGSGAECQTSGQRKHDARDF